MGWVGRMAGFSVAGEQGVVQADWQAAGRLETGAGIAPAASVLTCCCVPTPPCPTHRTQTGALLDPTDASGCLSSAPGPGLPWLPVDITLAYINEPPLGAGGCSVTVEDDPSDVCGLLCVAARRIEPGEEVFMDYGIYYDRSSYSAGAGSGQERQGRQ